MTLTSLELLEETNVVIDDVPEDKRYLVYNKCCNKDVQVPLYDQTFEYVVG